MPLEKNNKNEYYLLGRYTAVVERSNNEPFTTSQFHNIMECSANLFLYDRNKANFCEIRQQIMSNITSDGFPNKVKEDENGGRFWIGYYHQKSQLPMYIEEVEHHKPIKVDAVESNEIDELLNE